MEFTESSLDEAETRFQQALLANDVAALDLVLHAEVRFTGPDGVTIDKAADLAAHRAGAFAFTSVAELIRDVQVINGIGITRCTLHLVGNIGETPLDAVVAYTRTWAPSATGWLIVAAHGGAVLA
jgi:hypothetical protein